MGEPGRWSPRLTTWLDAVDRAWAGLGLAPEVRAELRRDLVVDLAQALADGADPDQVVAADPRTFAADVAVAAGALDAVPPAPGDDLAAPSSAPSTAPSPASEPGGGSTRSRFVVVAALGGLAGAVVAAVTVHPWSARLVDEHPGWSPVTTGLAAVLGYVASAACVVLGSAAAAGLHHGRRPGQRRPEVVTAACLVVGGLVATAAATAFARQVGYSTRAPAVVAEVVIVILVCLASLTAAAHLSLARPAPRERQS